MNVSLPEFVNTKQALVHVESLEGKYIHVAWELSDGKIISFEYIPCNWPLGSMMISKSLDEYKEAIRDAYWILDKDYQIKFDERLKSLMEEIE